MLDMWNSWQALRKAVHTALPLLPAQLRSCTQCVHWPRPHGQAHILEWRNY